MENQVEINNLVNVARYHVDHAINAIEEAEVLSSSSRYISDLFKQTFNNLSSAGHYLNVANDITESVSV